MCTEPASGPLRAARNEPPFADKIVPDDGWSRLTVGLVVRLTCGLTARRRWCLRLVHSRAAIEAEAMPSVSPHPRPLTSPRFYWATELVKARGWRPTPATGCGRSRTSWSTGRGCRSRRSHSIDGIFPLDTLVGFLGRGVILACRRTEGSFAASRPKVFFRNDANGSVCAHRRRGECSTSASAQPGDMRSWRARRNMLGNIPPR